MSTTDVANRVDPERTAAPDASTEGIPAVRPTGMYKTPDVWSMLYSDGSVDPLLMSPDTPTHLKLVRWRDTTPNLHEFMPDFHRMQVEFFVWSHLKGLAGEPILDIGQYDPRTWLGDGYRLFGKVDTAHVNHINGDILDPPDALVSTRGTWAAVILTEVLEHVMNPPLALQEVHALLRPGGLAICTTPWMWFDHRTHDYPDYWRFTEQGLELLFEEFASVEIVACDLTHRGSIAMELYRLAEAVGWRNCAIGPGDVRACTTGYLVKAVK